MPVIQGLEWAFDTVAKTYEKLRPGYPDGLYRMLLDYASINESSCAVEVGIGGGQATLPILKTGCNVTAVECGENFSKICEKKFEGYENFTMASNRRRRGSMGKNRLSILPKLQKNTALWILGMQCSTGQGYFRLRSILVCWEHIRTTLSWKKRLRQNFLKK